MNSNEIIDNNQTNAFINKFWLTFHDNQLGQEYSLRKLEIVKEFLTITMLALVVPLQIAAYSIMASEQ